VQRFVRLTVAGPADPAAKVRQLHQALALWHGEPLNGISGDWAEATRLRLRQQWLNTVLACNDLELKLGRHTDLVTRLSDLVSERPTLEPLVAQLMLTLHRCGRRVEALDLYRHTRRHMIAELGLEPGPALQQLERAILTGDPALNPPTPNSSAAPGGPAGSRLAALPFAVGGFVGRDAELKLLDTFAAKDESPGLVVLSGAPGAGKTALAVHWAHRLAARFGDGQLFANLRGFDPVIDAVAPIEVLGRFLRGMGVEARAVPRDIEEAAGLYRSLLAGKRTLILLDNARDVEQVRPLLPGLAACHVIVTSRNQLGGLVAQEGAQLLVLDSLEPEQGERLLRRLLKGRSGDDLNSTAQLARRCAYLPLALRVAAANLACRPQLSIEDYVRQLDQTGPLAALHIEGDSHSALRRAFDVSYTALSPSAKIVFSHFGLVPGHDFEPASMAAMTASTMEDTRQALDELCATHLLTEDQHHRFGTHDLLRAYAANCAANDLSPEATEEAQRRLIDFYLDVAYEACLLVNPRRNIVPWETAFPPAQPLRFADHAQVLSWFDQEVTNLVGVLQVGSKRGWHNPTWRLAEMLYPFFNIRRMWREWLHISTIGLACAEASGDQEGVARMRINLGIIHKQTGDIANARAHWTDAITAAQKLSHRRLTAACRANLGGLCVLEDDPKSGADYLKLVLADEEYMALPWNGIVVNINYGCALIELDDLPGAKDALTTALQLATDFQDPQSACHAHDNLAEIALRQHDPGTAAYHAELGLKIAQQIGDPLLQAMTKDVLGSALCYSDLPKARAEWHQALTMYQKLGHRRGTLLDTWLHDIDTLEHIDIPTADHARRKHGRKML